MDNKLAKEIRELMLQLCELEADKYFFSTAVIRNVIDKEYAKVSMQEIDDKTAEVKEELKRLVSC